MKTEQFDYADESVWPLIDLRMHVGDLCIERDAAPNPRKYHEIVYVLGHAAFELYYRDEDRQKMEPTINDEAFSA